MKKGRLEEIDDEGGFKITALSRFLRIKSLKKSIEGGGHAWILGQQILRKIHLKHFRTNHQAHYFKLLAILN